MTEDGTEYAWTFESRLCDYVLEWKTTASTRTLEVNGEVWRVRDERSDSVRRSFTGEVAHHNAQRLHMDLAFKRQREEGF